MLLLNLVLINYQLVQERMKIKYSSKIGCLTGLAGIENLIFLLFILFIQSFFLL